MPQFVRVLTLSLGMAVALVASLAAGVIDQAGAVAAVIGMFVGMVARPALPVGDPLRESRIALARARREGAEADVLVANAERLSPSEAVAVASTLRVTDGVSLRRHGRQWELCAVLTGTEAREIVEERLHRVSPVPLAIGWARFPHDAVTFEGLVERARPADRDTRERGRSRLAGSSASGLRRWTARRQLIREEAQ